MKISVSLPEEDIKFLDSQGGNRSAILHDAVRLMRQARLSDQYEMAIEEWADSEDAPLWDRAAADGIA